MSDGREDGNKTLAIAKGYGGLPNISKAVVIIDYGEGHLSATLGEIREGEWSASREPREMYPWETGDWGNPFKRFEFGPWVVKFNLTFHDPQSVVREGSLDDLFKKGWTEQKGLPSG